MTLKILFVCLGNICRSPAAEAILQKKATEAGLDLHIESAAIGDWHVGQLAEYRTRDTGTARGYRLASRAKKFIDDYYDQFDLILAADQPVLHQLMSKASAEQKTKISLMTSYSTLFKNKEIPDPYYGDQADFEHVYDMLEDSCDALIDHLKHKK